MYGRIRNYGASVGGKKIPQRKVSPYERARNIAITSPVGYTINIVKKGKVVKKLKKLNNNTYKDMLSGVIFNISEVIQEIMNSDNFKGK